MARRPRSDSATPEERPGRSDPDGAYEVGYGKPPERTRFKPGQSGNLRGRPKRHRNLRTVVEATLQETITIREGERTRTMPRIDALVRTIMHRALKGDPKAVSALLMLIRGTGMVGEEISPVDTELLSLDEEALLTDYLRRHGAGAATPGSDETEP